MDALRQELKSKIETIMNQNIQDDDNLYELGIDSFTLAHLLEALDEFSSQNNVKINIDALVTEDNLSLTNILRFCRINDKK